MGVTTALSKRKESRTVLFDVWSKELGKTVPKMINAARVVRHKGKTYKLFTLKVLANVLAKHTDTLMKWEREGRLPKAIYKIGESAYRYYSEDQIRMVKYFQDRLIGSADQRSRGNQAEMESFFKAVSKFWAIVTFDEKDFVLEIESHR